MRNFVSGEVEVVLKNDKGQDIPIQMTDNEDATYTVDYCPPAPGNYTVIVRYGGKEIPQSPIRVPITASVDVSKIKVDGLEPSKMAHTFFPLNHFHITLLCWNWLVIMILARDEIVVVCR
jgi:hypothetical protein